MTDDVVFFKWQTSYNVNIKVIDQQHRELVNILNRLFVAISKREADKTISGILDAMVAYTRTHFELEERLLQQANYSDYAAHKEEHVKLLAQLDELCRKHMVEEKVIYFEMVSFLKNWLKEHILGVDMKYSQALQRAGFDTDDWETEAGREFAKMQESKKWWEVWKAA